MSLKNQQYNVILREYDKKQLQNRRDLDLRVQEVYRCVPKVKLLDEQIAHNSVQWAKRSLFGNKKDVEELISSNQLLINEKESLLIENGYPSDYLATRYHCPDCQDTGYVGEQKCHCFKQAIVDLLYSQSNIRSVIEKENFSSFSYRYYSDTTIDKLTGLTPLANIQKVVSIAKQFVEKFDETYSNLLLYGNTGVGKTFLSNCIAKELIDSAHTVVYLTSFQLFDLLEKYKFNYDESREESNERLEYILQCDLLIIDDLGTELVNAFVNSQFFMCINERHLRQKSTIISTNLSFEQIQNTYSERIFSRITSHYILLKILGEDIRFKKSL